MPRENLYPLAVYPAQKPIMVGKAKALFLWITAVILLLASAWSFNVGTYDLFAADFPGPYRHVWVRYAYVYLGFAVILFAAFLSNITIIIRSFKKRTASNQPQL